jgi:hypothetical protein
MRHTKLVTGRGPCRRTPLAAALLMLVLMLPLMLGALAAVASAQEAEEENAAAAKSPAVVPDEALAEAVRRILVYNFKPRRSPRTVPLAAANIRREWLPEIANVEFRLLSEDEAADAESLYFFTAPATDGRRFEIGFARGDPRCDYSGEAWYFRIEGASLRLWKEGIGFGGGCGGGGFGGGSFKPPAVWNVYPNELPGYRFWDRGRLNGLRLGVSTREDVARALGARCAARCDLDANWEVRFEYFGSSSREMTTGGTTTRFAAAPQSVGRLGAIALSPKRTVMFDKVVFSSRFARSAGQTFAHDGAGGGTNSRHDAYTDRYGLTYTVLDEISLTTRKDLRWRKGELIDIEYRLPAAVEDKMYVAVP